MDSRVLFALRSLGADIDRLPAIPDELADYIAGLTPEDLERIRGDVEELEARAAGPIAAGFASDRLTSGLRIRRRSLDRKVRVQHCSVLTAPGTRELHRSRVNLELPLPIPPSRPCAPAVVAGHVHRLQGAG